MRPESLTYRYENYHN